MNTQLLQRIEALENKIADLEAKLGYWDDLARPPPYSELAHMRKLGFNPIEAGAARLFAERGEVGHDLLASALALDEYEDNYPKVLMSRLRKVLSSHGINIETVHGWGYRVQERERLKELLARTKDD